MSLRFKSSPVKHGLCGMETGVIETIDDRFVRYGSVSNLVRVRKYGVCFL